MKQTRGTFALLLIIGLGFAILGQFYFAYRREYVWDGVLFWCIAIGSFGLLLRRTARQEKGARRRRRTAWTSERWSRTLAVIGGAWLAFLAGWLARRPEMTDFGGVLLLWVVGVAWFLLAFVPVFSAQDFLLSLGEWLRGHQAEMVWLAALLLLALAVRAVDLEHIPANLGGDEGTQGVAALELLGPPLGNPFATGWFGVPTMSFLAYGISMRIFGESVAGLRALSALVGTATVLTTFLLGRELWGRRVAWMAAITLTCSHFHVHFSRLGSNQIFDGFVVTLSLWLFSRALRSRRPVYFALAGAVIGWGWYGYFGARLVGVVVACYLTWRVVVEYRFLPRYGRLLLILIGAALVVVAPLLLYYAEYPHHLMSRARQVSIFASGWLDREQELTGRSVTSLLFQQLWKSVSAFNYTLDPTFWYHASIPLLDFISGTLFILGLLWTIARCRWPNNGLLLLWFWLALILGWVITENPPSSMRLTIVAPALALLVGLGLHWLVDLSWNIFGSTSVQLIGGSTGPRRWTWLVGVWLAVGTVLNLRYYFLVYTPSRVYGNPTAEVATELGRQLMEREDDQIVYFHAPPYMYWNFGTLAFLARGVEGVDIPPSRIGEWQEPDLSRGARFVFLPERLEELDAVRERYPGGKETAAYSSTDERLLYVLYEVGE